MSSARTHGSLLHRPTLLRRLRRGRWRGVLVALVLLDGCGGTSSGPESRRVPLVRLEGHEVGQDISWGELVYYDVSGDGDVLAMDRYRSQLVRIRRATGEVLTVGRHGEGPGEIGVGGLVAFAGDRLVLSERGRISAWDASGKFLGSVPAGRATELTAWDSSTVIVKIPTRAETGLAETYRLHRFDLDSMAFSETFFESGTSADAPGSVSCSVCEMVRSGDVLVTTLAERSGRYATIDPETGVVTFFSGAGRERVPFSEEEWARYMTVSREHANYLFSGRGLDIRLDPGRAVGTPSFPKPMLAQDGSLGATPDGRIWLLAGVSDSLRTKIDVFGAEGDWQLTLHVPQRLERIVIGGWWLVGLAYDDLGRPKLFRYDLSEVGDGS